MYLIGQTGSGKSTAIYHMAKGDIQKGRGLAVVDPHGDLAEDLLSTVPESRIGDLIYLNPFDIKYPIGINLLELPSGLDEDEMELEKELACESVVSVFRRIFNKDENTDAHRIEYVLRNAIHTAFTVEDATIFTVYELLNNPTFQKKVISRLKDQNLRHFWKNEFGKAGNYQIVKMVSGVTAKIGRLLFSPIAKRILEQSKTILDHLHSEFGKLQTGRAQASLVEHIMVESYGQKMDLRSVASISVQDASSIVIQPWDKSVLASIEKALQVANIGANPVNDGVVIRLTLPPMTQERRVQLTKIVGQLEEDAKIKVRQIRQDAQAEIKKEADEDVKYTALETLQKLVDDVNGKIEEAAKKKNGEVMSV
jgi:ribosome recycling factor